MALSPAVGAPRLLRDLCEVAPHGGLAPGTSTARLFQLWVDAQEDVLHPPTACTMLLALLHLSAPCRPEIALLNVTAARFASGTPRERARTTRSRTRKHASTSAPAVITMPLMARVMQIAALAFVQALEARRIAIQKATRLASGPHSGRRVASLASTMLDEDDEDLSEDDEEFLDTDEKEYGEEERISDDTGRARLVPADEVNILNFNLSDMLDGESCGSDEDSDVSSEADDESRDPLRLAEVVAESVLAYAREIRAHLGEVQFASFLEVSSASSVCDSTHCMAIHALVQHCTQ